MTDDFLAACSGGDWPAAVAQLDRGWTRLVFDRDTYRAVFALLGAAPEEELRRHPRTALMAESVGRIPRGTTPVRLPAGRDQVDRAVSAGHARDLVEVAALGMVTRRATGLPREALEIARASRPLLQAATLTRFSPAADLAAYWHLQAAQAALHAGELEQARLDVEQAWAFRADDVTGYAAPSTAPFGVLLAALGGDHAARARWEAEVDALTPASEGLIEWDTMRRPVLVAALLTALDRDDAATAEPLAAALLPQLAFDELWPFTLLALVRHLVATGAVDRADLLVTSTLDRHAEAPRTGSVHATYTALALAEIARARGGGQPPVALTPAEERALAELAHPGTLTDVAARLHVSRNTLKTQLRGLYAKLGVSSRAEALDVAGRRGPGTAKARHP